MYEKRETKNEMKKAGERRREEIKSQSSRSIEEDFGHK